MRLRELEPGRQSVPMRFSFILLRRRQQTPLLATIRHIGIRRHFHPPNRYDTPPPGWMKKTANISLTQTHCKIAAEVSSAPHRISRFANYSVGGMDRNLFVCKRVDLNRRVAQMALMGISSVRYRRNPADLRMGRCGF